MSNDEQLKLGFERHSAGDLPGAEAMYRQVLAECPDQPDALHLLGVIALQAGSHRKAEELIGRAIAVFPRKSEFHANLGLALFEQKRGEEAVTAFRRSLAINPAQAMTRNNLANALRQLNRREDAISEFRAALRIDPNCAEAAFNLGNVLESAARFGEAIDCFRTAVKSKPDWREANNNLGRALTREGRFDESAEVYRKAVERLPQCALSHFNHAVALLRQGDFRRGWPEYEWRLSVKELGLGFTLSRAPRWDGSELNGRSILLYAEQGLGDTIQFARYATMVKGGKVTVAVQPELTSLLGGVPLGRGTVPECDVQCPLPSLPLIFKTEMGSIPADVPYVRANPEIAEKWRKRIAETEPGRAGPVMKVGLCWAGRPIHSDDTERSLRLEQLAGLAQSGAWLISLQKGQPPAQADFEMTDWTSELTDFSETAGLVENLDLVVTVDTSVAHLAGAMGKPVWVLLSAAPDWRWMLGRSDSPWYPTMQLFRQEKSGDWNGVIDKVVAALREL